MAQVGERAAAAVQATGTPGMGSATKRRQGLAAIPWQWRFWLLAAIWGSSFLFIKVGDEALAPAQVTLGRMVFGSVALLCIVAVRREKLPRGPRAWAPFAVSAFLLNALPFTLFAYGETRTTSVLAGIWNATTPLCTILVALALLPEERPNAHRITGLVTGFCGVLIVLGVWQGFAGQALIGNLACLGAAISYGFGFPYTRKHLTGRKESWVILATAQLLCGTIEMAIVTPFLTHVPATLPLHVVASIVALGVFGTGLAYVLNYGLIMDAGATLASSVTYVVPLFSTLEGAILLKEPLTWYEPIGALIVILGVAISQGRLRWGGHH